MRTLILSSLSLPLTWGLWWTTLGPVAETHPVASASPVSAILEVDHAPHGRYVEARTASVFAGACHYGGEATTIGREALLAWHFTGGEHAGVDLAGVDAAVALAGEANLAEAGAERHSIVYVSDRASRAQRTAVEALLRERLGEVLGTVRETRALPLTVSADERQYAVEAGTEGDAFTLHGATLADRACCHMPFLVWYTPFAPVEKPIVGLDASFRYGDERLGRLWSRPDENASFSGAFRFAPLAAR